MSEYNIKEQAKEMALVTGTHRIATFELYLEVAYQSGKADGQQSMLDMFKNERKND